MKKFQNVFVLLIAGMLMWRTDAVAKKIPFTVDAPDAGKVSLAGSFNGWKMDQYFLDKGDDGKWSIELDLDPGDYEYKFLQDGEWTKLNPDNRKITVEGDTAALAPADVSTTFNYVDENAKTVHLAGEFNAWLDNVSGRVAGHEDWMMQGDTAGNWTIVVPLKSGQWKYKYVIDGGEKWAKDPNAPTSDDDNSIVKVAAAVVKETDSSSEPVDVTFRYADALDAQKVGIGGEFNSWKWEESLMAKDTDGVWTLTMPVKPGEYAYKIVVDGDWRLDPATDLRKTVGGTENSMVSVAAKSSDK